MPLKECRRRANDKYKDKFDLIQIRLNKGNKEIIQGICKEQNTTVSDIVNNYINKYIKDYNNIKNLDNNNGCPF